MTDEQLSVVAHLVEQAADTAIEQSDLKNGGNKMKPNAFDNQNEESVILQQSDIKAIFTRAQECGSLKQALNEAVIQHSVTDIGKLFPDAQTLQNEPYMLKDTNTAADAIFNATHKSPFSRIKTIIADMTAETCRARGYITGAEKFEQVFSILDRSTTPQTVYKKQKIDRDDYLDITDFNIVNYLKKEMAIFLKEEIARALLVGDGRLVNNADKIKEDHIRPILTDADTYTIKVAVTGTHSALIDSIIKSRSQYRGSGSPTLYLHPDDLADLLLLKDNMGRYLYETEEILAKRLRVKGFVETSFMTVGKYILVNLTDYTLGADKGGNMSWFDDFDINYNKMIYLIETRMSGALTKPKSAIVFTLTAPAEADS